MDAKRLLKLAEYLKTVPPKRFDMETWANGQFCNLRKPSEAEHAGCGTSACAMGWATTIPSFKRAGLKMDVTREEYGEDDYYVRYEVKYLDSVDGFDAATKFFGLSPERDEASYETEAEHLFGTDHSDKTPLRMARRIERFVKSKQNPKAK